MKKSLSIFMSFILALILFVNFPIYASEKTSNNLEMFTLQMDQYTFEIYENDFIRKVITYDSITKEEYTAIYNKETNILTDEYGNYLGNGYIIAPYTVNGPFKAYFDVHPKTGGVIVGTILAVSTFVGTAATAGVGLEALKIGLNEFFTVGGKFSLLDYFVSGVSINGYFEYSQENNFKTGKARNINRKIHVRIGYKNKYSSYSYGNGSWFDTRKP